MPGKDQKSQKPQTGGGDTSLLLLLLRATIATCWVDLINDLLQLRLVLGNFLIPEFSSYTTKILEVNET